MKKEYKVHKSILRPFMAHISLINMISSYCNIIILHIGIYYIQNTLDTLYNYCMRIEYTAQIEPAPEADMVGKPSLLPNIY